METFLDFLKEVLKGIIREISAYHFRKRLLETRKPPRRRKLKGGSRKTKK
ncbi:hypothetical protein [Neobacillus sp. D3-1R]